MDNLLDDILNEDVEGRTIESEDVILAPLLDEINAIEDQSICSFVRSVLYAAPPFFWVSPASFSGKYHPPDERGDNGNVLHTQRVVRIVQSIAQAQQRSQYETDILVAAALLHDLTKGVEYGTTVGYDPMHPYTVDRFVEWVREEDQRTSTESTSSSLYIDEDTLTQILRLVRCHMGVWSPIPETVPLTTMDWTLHLADMLASRIHTIIDGENVLDWRWQQATED